MESSQRIRNLHCNNLGRLFSALLALSLVACATLDELLMDYPEGSFTRHSLPMPEPGRGSLGINLQAGWKIFRKPFAEVYFVRLDEAIEPYAGRGVLWPNYSRSEQLSMMSYATEVLESNYGARDAGQYRLNAEPGRYVAVGGWYLGEPPQTFQPSTGAYSFGAGSRPKFEYFFSSELIALTEAVVRPGQMTFMGKFHPGRRLLHPGDVQLHYAQLKSPNLAQWAKGGLFTQMLGSLLYAGQAYLFWARPEKFSRDVQSEQDFWDRARRTAFKGNPAWLELARPGTSGSTARAPAAADVVKLDEEAGYEFARGDLDRAIAIGEEAVRLGVSSYGSESPRVAALLTNLADVHHSRPDYARALPLYERARSIREHAFGLKHPAVANTLVQLGLVHRALGDAQQAEASFRQALAIREQTLGAEHLHVADSLAALAPMHHARQDYVGQGALIERALAIRTDSLGPNHPLVAKTLVQLASARVAVGDYLAADRLLIQAAKIQVSSLGAEHPEVADSLAHRAELYRMTERYAEAAQLAESALEIRRAALGRKHPAVADSLVQLALVCWSTEGQRRRVGSLLAQAGEIRERQLALVLATGSEAQKLRFAAAFSKETNLVLSFHLNAARDDPDAARLALTTLLRRKGRVLDATAASVRMLRGRVDPRDDAAFEKLNASRARLAALTFRGPGGLPVAAHMERLAAAEQELAELEAGLSARSSNLLTRSEPLELDTARARLPAGSVLVEFASYEPLDFEASEPHWGERRYAAYVLDPRGEVRWVELGDAPELNRLAMGLRTALATGFASRFTEVSRALEEALFQPVRALVGDARHLLISPDGALNLIPFAALLDDEGRFLVERYTITYLASGRDLVRSGASFGSREKTWIVAAPDFGMVETTPPMMALSARPKSESAPSSELELGFSPLPGTEAEARALAALIPDTNLRLGVRATEGAIKGISGPEVLHIATHGFFLADQPSPSASVRSLALPLGERDAPTWARTEDPLLRSGLALAGANHQGEGGEDGILTALEASGLDLDGTELVVLSACETGIGEILNGEGVFGLRRAFVIAGSASQLMSLWRVDDRATKDLMIAYYEKLRAGRGRSRALREVQLDMLSGGAHRHPYFWASFIQSGDWGPIWPQER